MRLISLEMEGFKSFADKTVIDFQPGMTGIIGPNGSGKSNIIEALRWVMGEQSAKSLRGDKMADVIFNGAEGRSPLNRAQVKMTLDNSDHYLASDFTELTVTRRLYRSGESDYLINDRPVRLKDIVDLFVDSGIGRESFSIISQGQVAAIFNGKPADRRGVIETVAGVAKYKQNKQTAEKRLQATQDNLNRVNDIVAEIATRMGPLEEQSALAQDYLDQRTRLDRLDRTQTVRQLDQDQAALTKVQADLEQRKQLADDYEAAAKKSHQRLVVAQAARHQQEAARDQAQTRLMAAGERLARLTSERSVDAVKDEQAGAERKRLTGQVTELKTAVANHQEALATAEQEGGTLAQAISERERALEDITRDLAPGRAQELAQEIEQLRNRQVDLMQAAVTIENDQHYLKRDHQRDLSQAAAASTARTSAQAAVETATATATAAQTELKEAQKQGQLTLDRYQRERATAVKLQADYETASQNWYQALGDLSAAKKRVQSYQAMTASYTGYYHGVQAVLRKRDDFPGLAGPVSELITVPARYTQALETVLGSQLQQLVVDRQATGKAIINFLIRTRGGRATILPLDTLRGGWAPKTLGRVTGLPGYLGRAGELIDYDAAYQLVVDHLLSTTVVADNLDHATAIARAGQHQLRVVTLDGQLINASGAMTGGANCNQAAGLLTQQQQVERLKATATRAATAASQLEERVHQLKVAKEANQAAQEKLRTAVAEDREQVATLTSKAQAAEQDLATAKRQVAALDYQTSQQASVDQTYQERVTTAKQRAAKIQEELTTVKDQLAEKERARRDLAATASARSERVHQLKQWLAVAATKKEQQEDRVHRLQTQLAGAKHQLAAVGDQLSQLAAAATSSKREREERQTAQATAANERAAAQAAVTAAGTELAKLDAEITAATAADERRQGLLKAALNDRSRLSAKEARLKAALDQGLSHLQERYQMSLTAAREDLSDLPAGELARQVKLLRRGIADLGTVNTGAIAEFQQVKERYEFLTGQQADLLTAKAQLVETMTTMDEQVKTRFLATFKEVSAAFAETFTQIFDGGEARLVLTEPEAPLTTGVDIIAQPPGKRNQRLSLLSGGERALTAITLLFAILKVRPVPFAILDEPEAALDAVNVDRFAHYLDRFGQKGPQFIVITHRKGTMLNADVLYGVTMQRSGVSKMVAVNVKKTMAEHGKA